MILKVKIDGVWKDIWRISWMTTLIQSLIAIFLLIHVVYTRSIFTALLLLLIGVKFILDIVLSNQLLMESFLPIRGGRKGNCRRCSNCCTFFSFRCPMLWGNTCIIYRIRPLQCRKFPRTEKDLRLVKNCGYFW